MATTKNNPGINSCYERAEPDEPMFVLLGRDVASSFVIALWARIRHLVYGASDQIVGAHEHAEELRDWATKLGKKEHLLMAYDAFRTACAEVAKKEIETDSKELFSLINLYGIRCDRPEVKDRALALSKKLAGIE